MLNSPIQSAKQQSETQRFFQEMLDIQKEICEDWVRLLQESAQDGVIADIQELLYMLALECKSHQ